jgi:serine/threonine-protein kinase
LSAPARGRASALEAAGRFFEAALAYEEAQETELAIENLGRLTASHPRYREACRHAVRLAAQGAGPSLVFENLLAAFVRGGPEGDEEAAAFRTLAELYERCGIPENAVEVLQKLVAARPGDAEALALLERLRHAPSELPELPELGPEPQRAAAPLAPAVSPATAEEGGPAFRVGALISERYRLDERIGSGGSSVVFRATDALLGDKVAIKVLTHGVYDRETDERLRRELVLSRRIQHRNVVRLFDIGLAHGFRFISMELLSGIDLRARMRGSELPLDEGLDYLIQACHGLEAAHAEGIVHRDVKPENCFITRGGVLKLMDFGLAKPQEASGVTTTGIVAGTPAYMAPEQVMDFRKVSPSADLYSLGIVAYEMFTGHVPFDHAEPIPLMLMHMNDQPAPPRSQNPLIPEALEQIILDCLEKNPSSRVASSTVLSGRLQALRDRL